MLVYTGLPFLALLGLDHPQWLSPRSGHLAVTTRAALAGSIFNLVTRWPYHDPPDAVGQGRQLCCRYDPRLAPPTCQIDKQRHLLSASRGRSGDMQSQIVIIDSSQSAPLRVPVASPGCRYPATTRADVTRASPAYLRYHRRSLRQQDGRPQGGLGNTCGYDATTR